MSSLSRLVAEFRGKHILAFGDLMMDAYIEGDVSRISPEAPVPVLRVRQERFVPGGVGNTAFNLRRLGAEVTLAAVIGPDQQGKTLVRCLSGAGIGCEGVLIDRARPTITKTRVVTRQQQMLRIDREETDAIGKAAEKRLGELLRRWLRGCDAAIISDYAKGTVTPALAKHFVAMCGRTGIPVIVDPKPQHAAAYEGATLITPNTAEAAAMVGFALRSQQDVLRAGRQLATSMRCNILITQGERGMTLFEQAGRATPIPTQAREVFDVSGAGDTVAAVMALGLASNADLRDAAIVANHAAGIVVAKLGTATAASEELCRVLEAESGKVKSLPELVEIVRELKRKGRRIVWTNGCFDILHVGHTRYLNEARKLGDTLILGLNTDASVRRLKGPARPILPQQERAEVLSSLSSVDYILFFDEDTPIKAIRAIVPDVIAKGGDYTKGQVVGHELMEKTGGRVAIVPLVPGYSTSAIISKIKRS